MENSITVRIPQFEILEKGQPKPYEIKDKNGNVLRSGSVNEIKVNSPGFSGWVRCSDDVFNSLELRKSYTVGARIYENTTLKNLKVTEIIK